LKETGGILRSKTRARVHLHLHVHKERRLTHSLPNTDDNKNRASFGTTKYCNTFLRYVPCTTPDCLFLHDVHEDEGWTKEEIQVR
jgi:hypothetical protein